MIITQDQVDELPDDEQMDFMENEHWIGLDHTKIVEDIISNKTKTWVPQYLTERLQLTGHVVRFNEDGVKVLDVQYKNGSRDGECQYTNLDGSTSKSNYIYGSYRGMIIKNIKIKKKG